MAAVALATACSDSRAGRSHEPDASTPIGGAASDAGAAVSQALSTSPSHTCALRKTGVFCWGDNAKGQLGDETTQASDLPVQARVSAADVVQISVQTGRSCVLRRTGQVACWGANEYGQLGDGTRNDAPTPVVVADIDDARQLALDEKSACVLRGDASVWCWGGSLAPTAIEGLNGAIDIQAGAMSTYCARGEEGWTRCFRLDNGAWTAPFDVSALHGARGVVVPSRQEVCGIVRGGEIVCHDLDNGVSVTLQGSRGMLELTAGLLLVCGGDGDGAWSCWNILPPVLETVGSVRRDLATDPLLELSTAGYRYCALREDRRVMCMESNAASPQFAYVPGLPD